MNLLSTCYLLITILCVLGLSTSNRIFHHHRRPLFRPRPVVPRRVVKQLNETGFGDGDRINVVGTFRRQDTVEIKFSAETFSCASNALSCQPLVINLQPATRRVFITFNGILGASENIHYASYHSASVPSGSDFSFVFTVHKSNFSVRVNQRNVATLHNTIGGEWFRAVQIDGAEIAQFVVIRGNSRKNSTLCGRRPGYSNTSFRIIGGRRASIGEFPWQASIREKRGMSSTRRIPHLCGATLVSSCWVITAAHCAEVLFLEPRNYIIILGDYNNHFISKSISFGFEREQDFEISRVVLYPGYNYNTLYNDIALIQLQSSTEICARFNSFVQPICLPTIGVNIRPSSNCYISGWGASNPNHDDNRHVTEYPIILQAGKVQIQNHHQCQDWYGRDSSNQYYVYNNTVCASGVGVDSCVGDSGGPLACKYGSEERFFLWGVTSWGFGCATPHRPGIYTKVSNYLRWIQTTISE